jgi:hypothetical protein
MINKEKTIQKMIARYQEIYPIPGKKDLQDCFFCLHGQNVIQFRTKDKKSHIEKVCLEITQKPLVMIHSPVLESIWRFLTQPMKLVWSKE